MGVIIMKFKWMMLVVLLVCLFAISAVSAADNATDDIISTDVASANVVSVDNGYQVNAVENSTENAISISNDNQVITEGNVSDVGTWEELRTEIDNVEEGGIFNLTKDYKADISFWKSIKKSITIDGKGHSIDGNGHLISFDIKANANFVTIKNLNFINVKSGKLGQVVYWSGGNGVLCNCSFVNCSVSGGDCTVYWSGGNGVLCNSSFVNCSVPRGQCVVQWEGDNGVLCNSSFVNSDVSSRYDGIVCWKAVNGSVIGCSFVNCESGLGILDLFSNGNTVFNSTFINLTSMTGASIYSTGMDNSVSNVIFTNCRGYSGQTHCIYENNYPINTRNITIDGIKYDEGLFENLKDNTQLNFDYNPIFFGKLITANNFIIDGKGKTLQGKISTLKVTGENVILKNIVFNNVTVELSSTKCKIINCSFINSFPSYIGIVGSNNLIKDCNFINCSVSSVITIKGNFNTVDNCNVIDCVRTDSLININGNENTINECSFIDCNEFFNGGSYSEGRATVITGGDDTNGIYIKGSKNTVSSCSFINCCSNFYDGGSMIFIDTFSPENLVNGCNFTDCYLKLHSYGLFDGMAKTTGMGGVIHIADSSFNIINSSRFIGCYIKEKLSGTIYYEGGAIYDSGTNSSITNSVFINCYLNVEKDGRHTGTGGAIYERGSDCNIFNCTFVECSASEGYGGAIYESGIGSLILNCSFINCIGNEGGSGFYSDGVYCILANSSFNGCDWYFKRNIELINIKRDGISHISLFVDLKNNPIFNLTDNINLTITEQIGVSNVVINGIGNTIRGSKFRDLVICEMNVTLKNIIFKDTKLIIDSMAGNCNIVNCTFINCNQSINTGGINSNIIDCKFINCSEKEGSAIYSSNKKCSIINCDFINCFTHVPGVIYACSDDFKILNSSFIHCSYLGGDNGGIVYSKWNSNCNIINTSFINCSENGGGRYLRAVAVYSNGDYCNISGCTFINCSSDNSPVLVLFRKQNTLMNCTFSKGGFLWNGLNWCADDLNVSNIRYLKLNSSVTISQRTFESGTISINTNLGGAIGIKAYVVNKPDVDISIHDNLIQIVNLKSGNYTLCVTTLTNNDYNPVTKYFDIVVTKKYPTLSVKTQNVQYGGSAVITVNLNVEGADVILELNEQKYTQSISYGQAIFEISNLKVGTYDINVTFAGDADYAPTSSSDSFSIIKKWINSYSISKNIKSDRNLTVTIPSDATGTIQLTIKIDSGDRILNSSIVNGVASFNISNLSNGQYKYNVRYSGDENYDSFKSTTKTFTIDRPVIGTIEPEIVIPPLGELSDNGTVTVTLPSDASGKVTLSIGGKDYNFDVIEGKANVKLPDLGDGDYPYTITYSGDSKYSSFTTDGNLKVNKTSVNPIDNKTDNNTTENNTSQENTTVIDNSKIVASNVNVVYSAGSYYTIKVYGKDGKPANGATVKISGKISKTLTATNGVAKFKVTNVPGTYKITITALGKTVTKTVTVKHIVTLKTVALKKSAKKLTLQATLAKVNGKYLKKKTITFKINGKKVATAKTNSKGVAKITIKNPSVVKKLKVGKKVTYQATYLKDTVKKTAKIKK